MPAPVLSLLLALGCAKVTYDEDTGAEDTGSAPTGTDLDEDGFYTPDDCDDENPAINPAAAEICDGVDNDCDGIEDEGLKETWYIDADLDGFGDPGSVVEVCEGAAGLAENADDCDDTNADVHPDADEVCNDHDDDCDGVIDEDDALDASTWYHDADGDLYGDDDDVLVACAAPEAYVEVGGDCADEDAARNPGVTELCNEVDDDCDEDVDEDDAADAPTWYRDTDGDGYGDSETVKIQCDAPGGYAALPGDCDERAPEVNPAAEEICDGIDNDCDAGTGEDGLVTFEGEDGTLADVSAYFVDGTYASPEGWVLGGDGTFYFCPGTYYTYLSLDADVDLVGVYGADETVLSAGGQTSVIAVTSSGVDSNISGLTLRDGEGDGLVFGGRTYLGGGGLYCAATSDVSLEDVVITDVNAGVGGGIFIEGCEVSTEGVEITDATAEYGGAVGVVDGVISLSTSHVHGNSATYSGGAIYADGSGGTTVAANVLYSVIEDNDATYGGGVAVFEAAMGCIGDAETEGGFFDNVGSQGGAAFVDHPTTFRSSVCDWGEGAADNTPVDIYLYLNTTSYDTFDFGDDETFNCNGATCD